MTTPNDTIRVLSNALAFLERIELKGAEVKQFNEVVNLLVSQLENAQKLALPSNQNDE